MSASQEHVRRRSSANIFNSAPAARWAAPRTARRSCSRERARSTSGWLWAVITGCHLAGAAAAMAQDTPPAAAAADRIRYYQDSNGITWREERSLARQPVRDVQLEPRQEQVYREQYRTQVEQHQYLSYSPLVQYTWVPRLHDWWRIFQEPYVAYHLEPQVQWAVRPYSVQSPVTRRELVAETRTTHVPVARLRFEQREQVTRTAVRANVPAYAQAPAGTPVDRYARGGWPAVPPGSGAVSGGSVYPSPGGVPSIYGGIARMDDGPPRAGTACRTVR